jgi:hypothetical protein
MPEQVRGQAGEPSRRAAPLALVLVLSLGCLNVDLPTVPATPPAPSLTVAAPKSGDTISLSQEVSVAAASVNGISTVSVVCGPSDGGARTVFTWASPPYAALVNFALCQDVTQVNPDGGNPLLQIDVFALSDAGALQDAGLTVFLNSTGPDLLVQYPPTAQPKSSFTVSVSANIPLRSIPEVSLGALAADSVTLMPNPDGGLPTYVAFFQSTPGLGADNVPYTPGVQVPIEALTDTDETVRLTVSGTALNGNTTELDLSVELSRVVWDRYIPGQPASSGPTEWAAQPLAFDGGLMLPLATSSPATSNSNWLPGLLTAFDGTFYGADPSPLDAGYLARGINAQGQTLFVDFNGTSSKLLLVPPPNVTAPAVTATNGPQAAPPLTRVDALLCLQDSVTACSTGVIESLLCLDPSLHSVTAASSLASTGPPLPGIVAGAGGRYLSPVQPVCGSSWNLVDLAQGTVSFGPLADPNGIAACTVTGISKLLAVGDGTFVVQLTESCGTTAVLPPEFPILRIGANSSVLGAYTAPLGTPALVQQEVVGVLVDGRVVTLTNAPPNTNFELWSLNSSTPDVVTPISGLYDSADAVVNSTLPLSTYSGSDGSFAVLLSNNEVFGAAVAAFGPNLQPRFLYLYPRIANASSTRLVSVANVPDVYLVDEENNHAVSLRAVSTAPPPDAGPADAGSMAGIYVAQGDNSVLVFSLAASGNAAPLRTIAGSQTGLSLPIGLAQDSQGNLYVANRSGGTVTVYPPLANGNVAPARTLTATGMESPEALAISVADAVFVSDCPGCSDTDGETAVFHFPAQSTVSDSSLIQATTGAFEFPSGIALGDASADGGQTLFVSNSHGGGVVSFAPGASGNATPFQLFVPDNGDSNPQSVAYGGNTLFLGVPGVGVELYPMNATGNPTASSTLLPPALNYPGGVAVDVTVSPPVVYLADYGGNALYVIYTSGELPNLTLQSVTTISGAATGLNAPLGVLLVK